jgi:hypothetical protein
MNEETLNLSIRTFLKVEGISSQREIAKAVAKAMMMVSSRAQLRLQHDVAGGGIEIEAKSRARSTSNSTLLAAPCAQTGLVFDHSPRGADHPWITRSAL